MDRIQQFLETLQFFHNQLRFFRIVPEVRFFNLSLQLFNLLFLAEDVKVNPSSRQEVPRKY